MTQLAALNVKITGDSSDLQSDLTKAEAGVKKVGAAATVAQTKTTGFTGGLSKLGNVSGSTRAKIQNTSFQLQDIAVQLQGGTRASTVFAQQLPQLLGGFGALGAVLGVVAGVGIPALAFAFSAMGDEAQDSEEAMQNFTASLKSATDFMRIAQTPIKDLREEFGEFADEIQRASIVASQAALSEALLGYSDASAGVKENFASMTSELGKYQHAVEALAIVEQSLGERTVSNASAFADAEASVEAARASLEATAASMGMTVGEATALNAALTDLSDADSMEEIATASAKALDLIGSMFGTSQKMPPEVAKIVLELEKVVTAAAAGATASSNLKTELEGGRDAARELADEMAFIQSLSPEVQARMVVAGVEAGNIPPEALADLPMSDADKAMEKILERRRKLARQEDKKTKSGGAKSNPLIGELEQLEQSLMTQEEMQIASFGRQQETLRSALEQKLLTKQEFDALTEDAQAKHNEAMEQLDRQRQQASLQGYAGMFGDLASLMQSNNKTLFRIGQASAIAEAVVNGYSAAVAAWEKGMKIGGPPVASAFAGASLLKTGALMSSIKSTSPTGSGAGATGGGAVGASGAAQAAPQTSNNVAISLTGGDMFSRGQVIELINSINDAVDDGARIRLV
jgi:hypothetical protein